MPAYLIANVEVTDPQSYEEYRLRVPAIIAAYGGRYLVRGGAARLLEGEARLNRLVVLEFPDVARANAFYSSSEYRPLIKIRQAASRGSITVVEGV